MIKMEPHKPDKIASGRLRLISVMSLVDQCVDRALFSGMQKTEIAAPHDHPCKSGWSPMPCGFSDLELEFPGDVLATDCSAFDWTFPSWLVEPLLQSRLEMMRGNSPEYVNAARARWLEVLGTACIIRLPDGTRLRQTVQGVMKSGWLLTISVNSQAQEFITRAAWQRHRADPFPRLWAMGDDVLMSWPGGDPDLLVREIARLGILTKLAVRDREFAGFLFPSHATVNPLYPAKHKFLLAHCPLDKLEEMCSAYGLLYALSEPPDWARKYITMYGRWTFRACRAWALGTLSAGLRPKTYDVFEQFYGFWD